MRLDDTTQSYENKNNALGYRAPKVPSLDAFLGENSRKRARVDLEDMLNAEDQDPRPTPTSTSASSNPTGNPTGKKTNKRGQKALRHLREIVGREGMGPVNYVDLASKIQVPVTLLDLFQMSPDLAKAFRKLSTRVNKKNSNQGKSPNGFNVNDVDLSISRDRHMLRSADPKVLEEIAPLLTMMEKAFRIPVVVRTKSKGKVVNVTLPVHVSQADQGSDMIVATIGLLKALKIPVLPLSDLGFSGLTMNVADGTSSELTHYAVFEIGVYGIWRTVEAFVRPYNAGNAGDMHLLLGMPWLHTVNAKIHIRDSVIELGDTSRGEKPVKIQGPQFVECKKHRLILHPANRENVAQDSSSDESSDESDSEISSDDEVPIPSVSRHQPVYKNVQFRSSTKVSEN